MMQLILSEMYQNIGFIKNPEVWNPCARQSVAVVMGYGWKQHETL